jgi:flavin reductase (DIM6/NTAB) family NADH-FMN oxidoreductase RutF
MIGEDWMLISAGDSDSSNTMTASWGGFGSLWGRYVAFIFVRPTRYTHEFIDNNENFTLSFFGGEYKPQMTVIGSKSGRDTDKITEAGLTPKTFEGEPAFEEAKIVVLCRKLYKQGMALANLVEDEIIKEYYSDSDGVHDLYIGEIMSIYKKEDV